MDIVLVTGGFDPLHVGHINYFNSASTLGDRLVVGLNSDEWLTRKKGAAFMPFAERKDIIRALRVVDTVLFFDDSDDTACHAIEKTLRVWSGSRVIFANGGDRGESNTPEFEKYNRNPRVNFAFNVGGGKMQSSSDLLARWENRHD